MANVFHATNKWVENLRVKWVKSKYNAATGRQQEKVCLSTKSFWTGDVEDVCGSFPDVKHEQHTCQTMPSKPLTWWRIAGDFIKGVFDAATEPSEAEKLRKFPQINFRTGETYYIDDRSEYDRLMSALKEV